MSTRLNFYCLLLFASLAISCSNDDDPNPDNAIVDANTLVWNLQGQDFSIEQESVEAIMTFTPDAHVRHLSIVGTTEDGEKLTLYIQELFPGGDGSCLSIESYPAEVIEDECFFDGGFLTICDHGGGEYIDEDGNKTISLDKGNGFVEITSCVDADKTISGRFSLLLNENQDGDPANSESIEGSFKNLVYTE